MIRNLAWVFAVGIALHVGATLPAAAAAPEPEDAWPALADDIFKGRPLADGTGLVGLEMPVRAEDAAIVPVTMRVTLPPGDTRYSQDPDLGDRRQSGPGRRHVQDRPECRHLDDLDARARQLLHQRACGRGAERRQALRGQDLREGLGRLLGARRQERRRGGRQASGR